MTDLSSTLELGVRHPHANVVVCSQSDTSQPIRSHLIHWLTIVRLDVCATTAPIKKRVS